ncbi:LLM class flavin-dependent oxidoreductase [Streptomyces sp. PT12]|uniref:LLM class flavin-dependent oxidoreductase n=1 Tax=Streptomyces sp. PT12 TaxID=1510197 RepID=UPI000DE2B101|nr:LLM class flavin-dependent oxidoreductase [Streptomyces sp. PT12]RBM10758.1 hypothetical protein DEH69_22730 [Streptomyces sp. PT12]
MTVAAAVEEAGFHSVSVTERLSLPARSGRAIGPGPPGSHVWEPLEVLTWAAAHTLRVRLLTAVVNAIFQPPIVLARRLATLDRLSRGRLDAGLGQGGGGTPETAFGLDEELMAAGVPRGRRGAGHGAVDILVELERQRAVEGRRAAVGVGDPREETPHGRLGRVGDLAGRRGAGLGEHVEQHGQAPGEPRDQLHRGLVGHAARGEQRAGLLVGEDVERDLGRQVRPVAPVAAVGPALPGDDHRDIGLEGAQGLLADDRAQPRVERRADALVDVEDEDEQAVFAGDGRESARKTGGQRGERVEHEPHVVVPAQPPGERGAHPVGAKRHARGVERPGQRADPGERAEADQGCLGRGHAARGR